MVKPDPQAKQLADKVRLTGMDPEAQFDEATNMSFWTRASFRTDDCDGWYGSGMLSRNKFAHLAAVACSVLRARSMVPKYELGRLSTFGAKKYSLHPLSPNSWVELPVSCFRDSIVRHHAQALSHPNFTEHREIIDESCTSCASYYIGTEYVGHHATAVLWSCIRAMWIYDNKPELIDV